MLHAFIDEAGDDGMATHCDPWLVMSAFVVRESEVDATRSGLTEGVRTIWAPGKAPRNASFKDTSHPKRKALLQLLNQFGGSYIAILTNKHALTAEQAARLRCPLLYHFMAKYLVERLTGYAQQESMKVNITFGARKQIRFTALEKYLLVTLRNQWRMKSHYINYEFLGSLRESPTSQHVLLQSADWIASGLAQGLNCDKHGNTEEGYAELMQGRFWAKEEKLWGCGLKIIPDVDHKNHGLLSKIDTWLEVPTKPNRSI